MRNPLPYGITVMPKTTPGTRVVQNPTLVRVQFQRRRARQLIKLIDSNVAARFSIYRGSGNHSGQGSLA